MISEMLSTNFQDQAKNHVADICELEPPYNFTQKLYYLIVYSIIPIFSILF